jgi:pimeloyl-ACP methyl ester carboxylesterase
MSALWRAQLPGAIELHYVAAGEGEPVVLLHGGMGDCHSWQALMQMLATRLRAISFSRRHNSPNRNARMGEAHALADDVQDLAQLAELLKLGSMHLVGTSYGALVALAYALDRPQSVRSLVLCEPPLHRWACRTPAGAQLHDRFMAEVWRPAGAAFATGEHRKALQLLMDGIWGGGPSLNVNGADAQRLAVVMRNSAAMQVLTQAADPFPDLSRRAVANLALPILLLNGQCSSALHLSVMEELAREMPRARRAIIPGAGHACAVDNPAAFNAAVLAFLTNGEWVCSTRSARFSGPIRLPGIGDRP